MIDRIRNFEENILFRRAVPTTEDEEDEESKSEDEENTNKKKSRTATVPKPKIKSSKCRIIKIVRVTLAMSFNQDYHSIG